MTPTLDIDLREDVVPYTAFRSSLSAWMAKTRETHRPILVTQNGKSASVLMDVSDFEALRERDEILQDLARAQEDIRAGRVYSNEEVFAELKGKYKA